MDGRLLQGVLALASACGLLASACGSSEEGEESAPVDGPLVTEAEDGNATLTSPASALPEDAATATTTMPQLELSPWFILQGGGVPLLVVFTNGTCDPSNWEADFTLEAAVVPVPGGERLEVTTTEDDSGQQMSGTTDARGNLLQLSGPDEKLSNLRTQEGGFTGDYSRDGTCDWDAEGTFSVE